MSSCTEGARREMIYKQYLLTIPSLVFLCFLLSVPPFFMFSSHFSSDILDPLLFFVLLFLHEFILYPCPTSIRPSFPPFFFLFFLPLVSSSISFFSSFLSYLPLFFPFPLPSSFPHSFSFILNYMMLCSLFFHLILHSYVHSIHPFYVLFLNVSIPFS